MAPPQEKKLDPRVIRTRKLLKEAFTDLMTENEFKHITVQNITERAMVNRATFYAHFDDKDALLNYTIQEDFHKLLEEKLENPCAFTMENMRVLMEALCDYLETFTTQCLPVSCQIDHPPIERHLHHMIFEAMNVWLSETGIDNAYVVAMTTSWAIFGPAIQWARSGHKQVTKAQLIDDVMAILEPGLMPLIGELAI